MKNLLPVGATRESPSSTPTTNGVSEVVSEATESPASSPQAPAPKPQQPLWDHLIDIDAENKKNEDTDELWEEAVAFVRKSGKASTSMLQRRFRIGYTRSARIIDAMEDNGIIGPPTGTSKAREVIPQADEENDQSPMNNE